MRKMIIAILLTGCGAAVPPIIGGAIVQNKRKTRIVYKDVETTEEPTQDKDEDKDKHGK